MSAAVTTVAAPGRPIAGGRAPRFPLLDSVRAIAALSVLAYHVAFASRATWNAGPLASLAARLDVGVAIFFLLSGFLLYRPFVRARLLDLREPSARAYGWRRALRIVPAYWVALTVTALWLGQDAVFHPRAAVVYYGFLQNYDSSYALGGLSQAWTLCIEVTFYAFLPVWALALRRLRLPSTVRSEVALLGLIWALSIALRGVAAFAAPDPHRAYSLTILATLPAWMDHFALGMAVAVLSVAAERDGRLPRAVAWVPRRPWLAWAVAAALYAVAGLAIGLSHLGDLVGGMTAPQVLGRQVLYAGVALFVLLPAVFPGERSWVTWVLGRRWLMWLGLISYGIYLWHQAFVEKVAAIDGLWSLGVPVSLTMLVLAGAGSIAVAWLSWRLVERPILRLKRFVGDPASPPREPETHAAMEPVAPAPAAGGR